MVQFVTISDLTPSGLLRLEDVERIVDSLRRGGLCVLPTETGYMLGAVATNLRAVEAAFRAKSRDFSLPMHVACSSVAMIERVARLNVTALRLLGRLTPGPVTVVVPKRELLPDRLVTLNGTVGVRVPDCAATLQILEALGTPLTASSLNESGQPPIDATPEGLSRLRWPDPDVVYVVVAAQPQAYAEPSTLVRVKGPGLEILRAGPVGQKVLEEVAGSAGYLEHSGAT